MADVVARHLADRDITYVVSSPLERALETAEPIAAAHRLEIAKDARLIEAENHFQGLTFGVGDGSLRHPRHWPKLINPTRPSWGEAYKEQAVRMLGAVRVGQGPGPRPRGGLRQSPAPDLDAALVLGGPAALARPAQARVQPGVGDDRALRGRPRRRGHL